VDSVVSDELDWLLREQPLLDYGGDAQAEVVAQDEFVIGRLLGLQIKGGDSQFAEVNSDEGWVFRDSGRFALVRRMANAPRMSPVIELKLL
jgi:hypothetical protein